MEGIRRQREYIRLLIDGREGHPAEKFDGDEAWTGRQVQVNILGEPRQISDDQELFFSVTAEKGQHVTIVRIEELQAATAKGRVTLAQGDQPPHPPEQRVRIALLGLDMHGFVMVL